MLIWKKLLFVVALCILFVGAMGQAFAKEIAITEFAPRLLKSDGETEHRDSFLESNVLYFLEIEYHTRDIIEVNDISKIKITDFEVGDASFHFPPASLRNVLEIGGQARVIEGTEEIAVATKNGDFMEISYKKDLPETQFHSFRFKIPFMMIEPANSARYIRFEANGEADGIGIDNIIDTRNTSGGYVDYDVVGNRVFLNLRINPHGASVNDAFFLLQSGGGITLKNNFTISKGNYTYHPTLSRWDFNNPQDVTPALRASNAISTTLNGSDLDSIEVNFGNIASNEHYLLRVEVALANAPRSYNVEAFFGPNGNLTPFYFANASIDVPPAYGERFSANNSVNKTSTIRYVGTIPAGTMLPALKLELYADTGNGPVKIRETFINNPSNNSSYTWSNLVYLTPFLRPVKYSLQVFRADGSPFPANSPFHLSISGLDVDFIWASNAKAPRTGDSTNPLLLLLLMLGSMSFGASIFAWRKRPMQ